MMSDKKRASRKSFAVDSSLLPIACLFLIGCLLGGQSAALAAGPWWPTPKTTPLVSDKEFFAALDLSLPGMEPVKKAAEADDFKAAKTAYLEYCRTKKAAKWRIDPAEKPKVAAAKSDAEGDRVCKHFFAMPWGDDMKSYFVGEEIDWSFNPRKPADPAYSYEWTYIAMNRMYDWNHLGEAYWRTLDEKYAREWVSQMEDWVVKNPVAMDAGYGHTFNWRTLEAGLRMAEVWPDSYFRFLNSPSFTPEAHATFVKSVLEHGRRLERMTLKNDHGGNWVTMELNGLCTAGILFPELKEAQGFVKTSFDRLGRELTAQVYPDGGQTELSPMYHQTAMDNFAALARTAKLNKVAVPEDYLAKLKPMYVWGMLLADQSGTLPPVNDQTSAMHIQRTSRQAYDLWGDKEFLFAATGGKEGVAPPASSFLPYSGYAAMRGGWDPDDVYLFFDGGPAGTGHFHEDMLNLYLRCFGHTLLTEAGGFAYDQSKWRAYVLGTTAHNTITVDGKQQQRGHDGAVPLMKPCPAKWQSSAMLDYASATYDAGYMEAKYVAKQYFPLTYVGQRDTSVQHTRHVLFLKPYCVLVVDMIDGKGTHRLDAYFHLNAPDAIVDEKTLRVQSAIPGDVQLGLYPLETAGISVRKARGQEDPPLGWVMWEKRAITTIVYSQQAQAPVVFATLLYPYKDKQAPEVTSRDFGLPADSAWARQIETPRERAVVFIWQHSQAARLEVKTDIVGRVATDAKVLVIRQPRQDASASGESATAPTAGETWVELEGATLFECEGLSVKAAESASLVIVCQGDKLLMCNLSNAEAKLKIDKPFAASVALAPGKWTEVAAKESKDAPPPKPPCSPSHPRRVPGSA